MLDLFDNYGDGIECSPSKGIPIMGVVSTYLSAAAVGALTAGVAASNVVVPPDETDAASRAADIDLAAEITIPILDIEPSPGPITIGRQILLTLGAETNKLFARVNSKSQTIYDLPGLQTDFQDTGETLLKLVREPGESIGVGLGRTIGSSGQWELLGVLGSEASEEGGSSFDVTGLTGGTEGIGAVLGGALSQSIRHRDLSFFDSGFTSDFDNTLASGDGQLSFIPFDGFKVVGGGIGDAPDVPAKLFDVRSANTTLELGSLELGAGGYGYLGGDAGLCLGSAKATASCGGNLAFASLGAPLAFDVHAGSTNIISGDFLTNELSVSVKDRQFSLTGAVGGSFSIGNLEIGRPIPIDIQIPRSSSMMLANNDRQSQTRESFRAVPGNSGSDNETGGRHRAPVRDAIADVKTAVGNAVAGRRAAED